VYYSNDVIINYFRGGKIMDCREFSSHMKDFIFDKLDDETSTCFVDHAKNCRSCYDELEVVYSMHRSLGDIMGPNGKDDTSDYVSELNDIFDYYYNLRNTNKKKVYLKIVVIVIFSIIIILSLLCFLFECYL
jgi:hypothetical protein